MNEQEDEASSNSLGNSDSQINALRYTLVRSSVVSFMGSGFILFRIMFGRTPKLTTLSASPCDGVEHSGLDILGHGICTNALH
jgi:hypothetical protein